jgi:hypothetical protein
METLDPIRTPSITHGRGGNSCEISIAGMTPAELDALQAALLGACWVKGEGGRLTRHDVHAPLPDPIADPFFAEGWQGRDQSFLSPYKVREIGEPSWSPSLKISHLCGYGYTVEGYKREATKLERWGFSCMRSRRGHDGRHWEIWYLPFLEAAKSELKEAIEKAKEPADWKEQAAMQLEAAVSFLCQKAAFGTLDVTSQRAAMTIE